MVTVLVSILYLQGGGGALSDPSYIQWFGKRLEENKQINIRFYGNLTEIQPLDFQTFIGEN